MAVSFLFLNANGVLINVTIVSSGPIVAEQFSAIGGAANSAANSNILAGLIVAGVSCQIVMDRLLWKRS